MAADDVGDGNPSTGGEGGDDVGTGPLDDGPVATSLDDTGVPPNPSDGDPTDVPVLGLPDGRYLLVVDTTLSPGLPLQWEVNTAGGGATFAGQSLSLSQGSLLEPRELIGGIWQGMFSGQADAFTVVVQPLAIPGDANPVTGGELETTALDMSGGLGPDGTYYCGEVDGSIVAPLDVPLTGSTFALIPVAAGAAWPEVFAFGC